MYRIAIISTLTRWDQHRGRASVALDRGNFYVGDERTRGQFSIEFAATQQSRAVAMRAGSS
jgi:hypothetical protein